MCLDVPNYCCCKKCENLVKTRKNQYVSEEINLGSMLCSAATAGYVHTLEKPSKIKENRYSNTLKYAILYAKFFQSPDMKITCFEPTSP